MYRVQRLHLCLFKRRNFPERGPRAAVWLYCVDRSGKMCRLRKMQAGLSCLFTGEAGPERRTFLLCALCRPGYSGKECVRRGIYFTCRDHSRRRWPGNRSLLWQKFPSISYCGRKAGGNRHPQKEQVCAIGCFRGIQYYKEYI